MTTIRLFAATIIFATSVMASGSPLPEQCIDGDGHRFNFLCQTASRDWYKEIQHGGFAKVHSYDLHEPSDAYELQADIEFAKRLGNAFYLRTPVTLQASAPLTTTLSCVIPDHGGSCSFDELQIHFSETPEKLAVRIFSVPLDSSMARSQDYLDLDAGQPHFINIPVMRGDRSIEDLFLVEGENRLLVQVIDEAGRVRTWSKVTIFVKVKWEF